MLLFLMYVHFSGLTYWMRSVFPSNADTIEKIEAKQFHLEWTISNNGVKPSDKREEPENINNDKIEKELINEKYLYEETRLQLMENIANLNLGHGKSRKHKKYFQFHCQIEGPQEKSFQKKICKKVVLCFHLKKSTRPNTLPGRL